MNRRGEFDENPDYKRREKTSRPDLLVKTRNLPESELFEAEEEKEEVAEQPLTGTEHEAPVVKGEGGPDVATPSAEEPPPFAEQFPEAEADLARFRQEDLLIEEWNNRRAKKFDPSYLKWLWESDFLIITDDVVRYIAQESPGQVESTLLGKLSPLFEDLGVPSAVLGTTLRRLLNKAKKK
jgi:hypothetical protein